MIESFILILMILSQTHSTPQNDDNEVSNFNNDMNFRMNLFQSVLSQTHANQNIIISPESINSLLRLSYVAAEGETAEELATTLGLLPTQQNNVALAAQKGNKIHDESERSLFLQIASKVYCSDSLKINSKFRQLAEDSFETEIENIDFSNNVNAVSIINDWVKSKTNDTIDNLIDNSMIDSNSKLILVNAIHFTGDWLIKPTVQTMSFRNNGVDMQETDFLEIKGRLKFDHVSNLGATIAELPYRNSNFSLMIILPDLNTDLSDLESRLQQYNLMDISRTLDAFDATVKIPKFAIETKLELQDILQNMGVKAMFSPSAQFKFFESTEQVSVSKVVTKTYIDVNEVGTEASAASGLAIRMVSLIQRATAVRELIADRPFMFAIRDDVNIYFMGHLQKV